MNVPTERFLAVFKWLLPIYGALHLIPMLLFKRKNVWMEPMKMLMRAGWGTARSSAFMGIFIVIYQCGCFIQYLLLSLWLGITVLILSLCSFFLL